MKQLFFCVMLLAMATGSGNAQNAEKPVEFDKEKPYIEVTGIAEKEIIPDEIFISITIKERQEGKETITIEKQDADLKAGLIAIGVNLNNLSLSDADAGYIRIRLTKKDVVLKSEYLLKVADAATVGRVFDKLDELKILDARISRVDHSKIKEFIKETRIAAIKAAKDKADYLLEAIGEKTGKALIVRETEAYYELGYNPYKSNVRSLQTLNDLGDIGYIKPAAPVIQFEKIKLNSAIYVKFEIK